MKKNKSKRKRKNKMEKTYDKYSNINLTAKLFRFLKYHNCFLQFKDALHTRDNGVNLYNTFLALKGKKELFANDPIKWVYVHNSCGEVFLKNLIFDHIYFSYTIEGLNFWQSIHVQWYKYVTSNFSKKSISSTFEHITIQSYFAEKLTSYRLMFFAKITFILGFCMSVAPLFKLIAFK